MPERNENILTADEAAVYMGVGRLDRLPADFRPRPMAYGKGLYHRGECDRCIEAAKTHQQKQKGRLELSC